MKTLILKLNEIFDKSINLDLSFMPKPTFLLIKRLEKSYIVFLKSFSLNKQDNNHNMISAFFGISSLSSISIGLQHTLDSISNVFFDQKLGSVILGVSIFSFGVGLYAPSLYSYFFPPISPTISVSPVSSIIEKTLEKTESLVPSKDVYISSIPSDTVNLKITDLEFIKNTMNDSFEVLTLSQKVLINILKARLSKKNTPPSNTHVHDTINEITPILDKTELATKFLENQLTIASHVDPSIIDPIVSQITNL